MNPDHRRRTAGLERCLAGQALSVAVAERGSAPAGGNLGMLRHRLTGTPERLRCIARLIGWLPLGCEVLRPVPEAVGGPDRRAGVLGQPMGVRQRMNQMRLRQR
jgi:hypothetical protein